MQTKLIRVFFYIQGDVAEQKKSVLNTRIEFKTKTVIRKCVVNFVL